MSVWASCYFLYIWTYLKVYVRKGWKYEKLKFGVLKPRKTNQRLLSNRGENVSMGHFKDIEIGYKNIIFQKLLSPPLSPSKVWQQIPLTATFLFLSTCLVISSYSYLKKWKQILPGGPTIWNKTYCWWLSMISIQQS